MNRHTCYTLYGSQPYVLTANWPNGFTPAGTKWVPATDGDSLQRMLRAQNQRNHARVFKNQTAAENYVLYKKWRRCLYSHK